MILRAILTIQLLIICASTILAQSDEVPSVAYEWYPRYVTFLPESKLDSVLVYANTDLVPVTYEIYQTEIASNSQLEDITSTIDAILSDERVQLAYVWVGGSASPDGPEATNRRLAGERAAALEQYLLSHSSVSADRLRVDNLGEDWYSIERAIRSSEIKDKSAVLNIITTEHDADRREQRLKRLSGGTTWRQLCSDIFPHTATPAWSSSAMPKPSKQSRHPSPRKFP